MIKYAEIHEQTRKTEQFVREQTLSCADAAWYNYCRDLYTPNYVYYKKGELTVSRYDTPIGYEVAIPERIPCNLTKEQMYTWIYDRVQRVPFLPAV